MTLKNIENATINITNQQSIGDDTEPITTKVRGRFYQNKDKFYIMYRQEEDKCLTSTMIKIDGDCVTVSRDGAYSSRMRYKEKCEHSFLYTMPYGQMPMKLYTSSLSTKLTEVGGSIEVEYLLYVNDEPYNNSMKISVCTDN